MKAAASDAARGAARSEEHTSELQSRSDLVCRLLLEKKIAPRLLDRLAHVLDDDPGEILEPLFHQVPEREEVPRAVQRRRPPPRVPAPEGLLNRGVDVVLRRQRNARDDVTGGGIRVLQPVRGLCRAPPTANIVLQIPKVRLHLRKQRG